MLLKIQKFTRPLMIVLVLGLLIIALTTSVEGAQHYIHSTTPTFFFHGSGSSYHAEEYMTNGLVKAGATKTVVVENISQSGKVSFRGHMSPTATNPIIEVNHQVRPQKPTPANLKAGSEYAYQAVHAAQQKWGFHTMNIVAHSAGNIDVLYMLMDHPRQLPRLKKQVVIAGHVNGFLHGGYPTGSKVAANGLPSKEDHNFTQMKPLRKCYPRGAKVLNIYGDRNDGSHSDGVVPVSSARTLKYLVGKRASSYQEVEIKGANAQHSHLHHNSHVNHLLIKFLFEK